MDTSTVTTSSASNTDFEELTQMMKNSLITLDNLTTMPQSNSTTTKNVSH